MKCPKCGEEMDLCEKVTSSGRDMRTYERWPVQHVGGRGQYGIALWQVLRDAGNKKR